MKETRLALITSSRVVIYEGKAPVATFDIIDDIDAEGIEEVRVADYRPRQLELELELEAEPA